MVRELLAANGGTFRNPPTNYYQIERDTLKTAENVAQVFMGIRIAVCPVPQPSVRPLDDGRLLQLRGLLRQIGRKQGEDYRETIVFNRGGGEVTHPVGGRTMAPKFLGGAKPDVAGKDRREVLAKWLASPENPYFATSVANRVWAHFFGIGIVEPVDDIRVSNPASNPELFQALGDKLTSYNYDFKQLVRDICNSHTYQRLDAGQRQQRGRHQELLAQPHSPHPGRKPAGLLQPGHRGPREVPGPAAGRRAVQIADGQTSNYFLTTFGRSPRQTVCATRGQDRAHALAGLAHAQRRHAHAQDRREQTAAKTARRGEKTDRRRRDDLPGLPVA